MRLLYSLRKKSKLVTLIALIFLFFMSFLGEALATTVKSAHHYNDTVPDIERPVCDNTLGDMQNLSVSYKMSEGVCLIRGINYSYDNNGDTGPHSVDLQFVGDSSMVTYSDTGIPHVINDSWRAFYCTGPIYLLDDDPAINFTGTQPSFNCLLIPGVTPSTGNSSYNYLGSGWKVDSYEYLVDILYERIIRLNITEFITGAITTTDNIDAYYVPLTAGVPYVFILNRISGTGNITMRLIANQELTNNTFVTSFGSSSTQYMGYTSSSNITHVLLVEAENATLDTGAYQITYFIDSPPTSSHPTDIATTKFSTETIDWYLYDNYGGSHYRVLMNTTPSNWYTWVNNTNLRYPIARSAPGKYNYTILYNDTGNNWGTPDTVFVTILDSPPTSNHPIDIITGKNHNATIPWILQDDFGAGYYRTFVNLTPSIWHPWINNTNLNYPINTSAIGTFEYIIQFNDSAGKVGTTDLVRVRVLIDLPPQSNHPNNITTFVNATRYIDWILTDSFGAGYYRVFINGKPQSWNSWINNTATHTWVNTTKVGFYNYTIQYNDSIGQWGLSNSVFVTVIIDTPPRSTHPNDITTTKSGKETIDWYLYDDFGSSRYRVLVNSTPSSWYLWSNNTNLQYPINRSVPGKYNYTILYNDTKNNWGIPDTVFVTVLDTPPSSNHPDNMTILLNNNATIPWVLKDDYGAGSYRVSVNTSLGIWRKWTNNTNLNYPIDTATIGTFNYTIRYNDSVGQWGIPSTVIITIRSFLPQRLASSNTPVNLTCSLNGTSAGTQNGFSISVGGWNSTFISASVSNVTLFNYLYRVEENMLSSSPVNTQQWVMGFTVTDSCKLDVIDFIYSTALASIPNPRVTIYNATYNPVRNNAVPDKLIYNKTEKSLSVTYYIPRWVSINPSPYWNGTLSEVVLLNINKTYKNTFFIGISASPSDTLNWYRDNDAGDADGDAGIAYSYTGGQWINNSFDLTLRLSLKPLASLLPPYKLAMTINSKLITRTGTWNNSAFLNSKGASSISMNVSSSWYSIAYTVNWTTNLQNITRAKTTVYGQILNNKTVWEVKIQVRFVPGSWKRAINITLSIAWNTTAVYRGVVEHSKWDEITSKFKKSLIIRDATDAIWQILCDGHNWISSITVNKEDLYTLDTILVNAHLILPVYDSSNNARLNITTPSQKVLSSYTEKGIGMLINFTWSIRQSIHTNGPYQLTIIWFNGTEVGLWRLDMEVYNSTTLSVVYPPHVGSIIEISRGSIFNLILYYNMSYWNGAWRTLYLQDIMGAQVTYSYRGSAPQPLNKIFYLNQWGWTIQLTAPESMGDYPLYINATGWQNIQNYTNFFIILRVAQYETQLIFNDTAKETYWNTPIAFTFTYSNLTNYPVVADNISIEWKYNFDSLYRGQLIEGYNYTLTYNEVIGVYTIVFANFSAHIYNLKFYIDANAYQGQEAFLNLIFNNRTTTLNQVTAIPRLLYQLNGTVTLTIYYKDSINNQGIITATIQSNWSIFRNYSVKDIGLGYYNVTLNISRVLVGNYSVLISASQKSYEMANLVLHLEIYGYATTVTSLVAANLTGNYAIIYAKENWTVTFKYINVSNGKGISNALISAQIGGYSFVWKNIFGGNYTLWVDTTKLPLPMAGKNYTLQISIGKTFYQWQRFNITLNVKALPSQLYPLKLTINAEINDFIEVQVQLNDTYNHRGLSGLVWYQLQGKKYQMIPGEKVGLYYSIINLTNYVPNVYTIQITSWVADYQNASTTITLRVRLVNYTLLLRAPSHITGGNNLTIQADLFNGTHFIGNALINFTIRIVLQNDTELLIHLSSRTASNGTASVIYLIPKTAISVYIVAFYQRERGTIINSNIQIVTAIDPWLFTLDNIFLLIIIAFIMGYVLILGVYLYRKKLRPKLMSVESKKRNLLQQRAENRREIELLTQDIKRSRAETLKETEIAKTNLDFGKAAKLYEKAGNLTLELADKSVAREFFLLSKDMQKQADSRLQERELKERREKLLERARESIRERDVVEAARNYRQVAEISRMLGEIDQADKFLKLADAAHERVEALKEGDLRKKSGIFLSKADKAMGKQEFLEAAENFEEAAKLMLILGEEEGVNRFVGWAKLARERDAVTGEKPKEQWLEDLKQKQLLLSTKAKGSARERNFEEAIKDYSTLTIYAMELGDSEQIEKLKKNIEFCRKQASMKELSPEILSLMNERKELLQKAEDAVKTNRFAIVAKYYARIAEISEIVDGKEVARSYQRQAAYYSEKVQEKKVVEKAQKEEELKRISPKIPSKPVLEISEDEIEETKAKLAETVKGAREAQRTGKNVLAKELYEKAAPIAASLKDKESESRYKQKAEEIGILKPPKAMESETDVRRKISDLTLKAEKAIQKKKFSEAKNLYEEISELFIQLGDDEAANSFLERANSVRRLIK